MSNSSEHAPAHDGVGASIAKAAEVSEKGSAKGIFRFACTGPLEHEREQYVAVRDDLIAARVEYLLCCQELRDGKLEGRAQRMLETATNLSWLEERLAGFDLEPKWQDEVHNVVCTPGKNYLLDNALAGSGYTATFYLGLISSVSYGAGPVAGDTAASHAGWLEAGATNQPTYSQGTRPAPTFGAAAAGVKATSASVVFSITGAGTAKGSFLITNSTKDGATGTLISGGLFTQGDRPVQNGDTINGTYQLSI